MMLFVAINIILGYNLYYSRVRNITQRNQNDGVVYANEHLQINFFEYEHIL